MSLNGINQQKATQQDNSEAQVQAFGTVLKQCLLQRDLTLAFIYISKHRHYPQHVEFCFKVILSHLSPSEIMAYLTDPKTQGFLLYQDLNVLLEYALFQKNRPTVSDDDSKKWEKVVVTIAQNPYWCQTLSYSFFVKLAADNNLLATYIASNIEFLRHLEPYHVKQFLFSHPKHTVGFLDALNKEYEHNPSRHDWIAQILKAVVESSSVQECLVKMPLFTQSFLKAQGINKENIPARPSTKVITAPSPTKAIEKDDEAEEDTSALVANLERLAVQLSSLNVSDAAPVVMSTVVAPVSSPVVHGMKRSKRSISLSDLLAKEENDTTVTYQIKPD